MSATLKTLVIAAVAAMMVTFLSFKLFLPEQVVSASPKLEKT